MAEIKKKLGRNTRLSMDKELFRILKESELSKQFCIPQSPLQSRALSLSAREDAIVSPWRGIYCLRQTWDALLEPDRYIYLARTLAAKHLNWIFCDISAAILHGMPVAFGQYEFIHILAQNNSHGGVRSGIRKHVLNGEVAVDVIDGIPLTSLERTVFDCAKRLDFPSALAIADCALRNKPDITSSLYSLVEQNKHARNITKVRKVVNDMDGLAESAAESYARALMIEFGYAKPKLQVCFKDPLNHAKQFRVDMLVTRDDGSRVAIEIDGRQKYSGKEKLGSKTTVDVFMDERQREALLTSYGLEVLRLHFDDLVNHRRFCQLMDIYQIPKRKQ